MTCHNEGLAACDPGRSNCRRLHCLPLALLFILTALVYVNGFKGTWVFDDLPNIVQNQHVHLESLDWESVKDTFYGIRGEKISRPLAYLSFGLNYYFHGLDVWGYHLVNFAVHSLAALFLYLFIFHTLHLPLLREKYADRAGSIALLAAALWVSSPIQVTAVTFIVQRMAAMCALFFIMALYFYLRGRVAPGLRARLVWFALCALAGALSLASKENAAMLPVVLYLFELLLIQGVTRQNLRCHLLVGALPLLFLAGMAFVLTNPARIIAGYELREFTMAERLLTQPRILLHYLSLIFYPMTDRFALIHEVPFSTSLLRPWTTLPAILFWFAWIGTALALVARKPLIAFCLLFFVLTHMIEGTVIALELVYEHRNYLPSMALFGLLSMGVISFIQDFSSRRLLHFLTALLLVVFIVAQGHTTISRNTRFADPFFLWSENADQAPGLSRVHTNLGSAYEQQGKYEEARASFEAAIAADRYHRLDLRALPLSGLGNYHLREGELDKAMDLYGQALAVNPEHWQAWFGQASALLLQGDPAGARETLEGIQAPVYARPMFRALYGLVLLRQGEYRLARDQALKLRADETRPGAAHKLLGEVHFQLGEYGKSYDYWREYAKTRAGDLEAQLALVRLGDLLDDQEVLRRAAVHAAFLKQGKSWEEVIAELEKSSRRSPLTMAGDLRGIIPLIRRGLELAATENGGSQP